MNLFNRLTITLALLLLPFIQGSILLDQLAKRRCYNPCVQGGCHYVNCQNPKCPGGACKFTDCKNPTCEGIFIHVKYFYSCKLLLKIQADLV